MPRPRSKRGRERDVDGGWAWMVVVFAIVTEFVIGSFTYTVPIYLVTWREDFDGDFAAGSLGVIVSEFGAASNITPICAGALCKRFGCRTVLFIFGLICSVSLLLASFATRLWHLHLFGIISGSAFGIAFVPSYVEITYCFKRHFGIVNGLVNAAMPLGGVAMSPVVEVMCEIYGWRGAMLIHSAFVANVLVGAAVFRVSAKEAAIIASAKERLSSSPPVSTPAPSPESRRCVTSRAARMASSVADASTCSGLSVRVVGNDVEPVLATQHSSVDVSTNLRYVGKMSAPVAVVAFNSETGLGRSNEVGSFLHESNSHSAEAGRNKFQSVAMVAAIHMDSEPEAESEAVFLSCPEAEGVATNGHLPEAGLLLEPGVDLKVLENGTERPRAFENISKVIDKAESKAGFLRCPETKGAATNGNLPEAGLLLEPEADIEVLGSGTEISPENFSSVIDDKRNCNQCLGKINAFFDLSVLLRNVDYSILLLTSMITALCVIAYRFYIPSKLVFDLGVPKIKASLSITVYAACSSAFRFINGLVVEWGRVSEINIYIATLSVISLAAVLNPVAKAYWAQLLLTGLIGMGTGNFYALCPFLCRQYAGDRNVANAIGLWLGISGIGALIGLQLMGSLYDMTGSYDAPFYVIGLAQVVAVVVMVIKQHCSPCHKRRQGNADDTDDGENDRYDRRNKRGNATSKAKGTRHADAATGKPRTLSQHQGRLHFFSHWHFHH